MWLIKSRFSSMQETVKERALKVRANVAGQVVIYHNHGYFNIVTTQISSQARLQTSQGSQNRLSLFWQRKYFLVDTVTKTRNKELEN